LVDSRPTIIENEDIALQQNSYSINKKMTIEQIATILNARIICGVERNQHEITHAFASDLMSDVLTLKDDNVLLITGLANVQTMRTAEMSDIQCVVFARNKKITPEMIELARENDIIVLECSYSVFRTCGLLYNEGVSAIF
jgi:serine kinase of HPr protein (carbohydrate metabolism regulator)